MKKITFNKLGLIFSIIGIVASILVIMLNIIDKENIIIGIALFCACFLSLLININYKK